MLTQVSSLNIGTVPMPLLEGMRERPPIHPPTVNGQRFSDDHVAFLCVRNQILRKTLALQLRTQGYQVIEAEEAEDLLLFSALVPAEIVYSDSLHVINRARHLVSERHTSLCAVMLRDDPYCEVEAFLMGATEVIHQS